MCVFYHPYLIYYYTNLVNIKGLVGEASGSYGTYFGEYYNGNLQFGFGTSSTPQRVNLAVNTSNFPNGTTAFNETTLTYDKNIIRLYVNGVLKQYTTIGLLSFSTANIVIGRCYNQADRYFQGNLRDIKMYNRPLTANEVLTNYNQNKSEGLVA